MILLEQQGGIVRHSLAPHHALILAQIGNRPNNGPDNSPSPNAIRSEPIEHKAAHSAIGQQIALANPGRVNFRVIPQIQKLRRLRHRRLPVSPRQGQYDIVGIEQFPHAYFGHLFGQRVNVGNNNLSLFDITKSGRPKREGHCAPACHRTGAAVGGRQR